WAFRFAVCQISRTTNRKYSLLNNKNPVKIRHTVLRETLHTLPKGYRQFRKDNCECCFFAPKALEPGRKQHPAIQSMWFYLKFPASYNKLNDEMIKIQSLRRHYPDQVQNQFPGYHLSQ